MKRLRAKFTVQSKTQRDGGGETTHEVELLPVTCGSEENESFYRWTPSGSIKLALASKATADALEVGKDYYVDFSPVEGEINGQKEEG